MDDASTLYGAASIIVGAIASVVVALVSRPHPRTNAESVAPIAGPAADPEDDRLSTVEGIAQILVQQGAQIAELQRGQAHDRDTIGALRRYVRALRGAMQSAGVPVPEPAPEDAPLISG